MHSSLMSEISKMNYIIFSFLLISYGSSAKAQWTPDPFCPFPSEVATRYPYYGDCSLYWECFEGTKYVLQCPEGYEFSVALQNCDLAERAQCDPFASTTANPNPPTYPTATTDDGTGPNCPPSSGGFLPYPGDCTKYWQCVDGYGYLYSCPEGLWWHQELSQCDYPGDYCHDSTQPTPDGTTGSTVTNFTPDPQCPYPSDEIVYFPYPGDCTKYLVCTSGYKYVADCPDGLWWHEEISQCDYPGDFCNNSL